MDFAFLNYYKIVLFPLSEQKHIRSWIRCLLDGWEMFVSFIHKGWSAFNVKHHHTVYFFIKQRKHLKIFSYENDKNVFFQCWKSPMGN
jgi:hypothetical protein